MKQPRASILEAGYRPAPEAYLTLAQVYYAQSYFHDYRDDIERKLLENTEEYGRAYLRKRLSEWGYLRVTGQGR